MLPLVLGSASPRRRDLLHSVGLEFEVVPADIDETPRAGEAPADYVARLAGEKCAAVAGRLEASAVVLTADTTVTLDGEALGKPADHAEARAMLRRLSGRTHLVHTAVVVATPGDRRDVTVTTAVTFGELTDAEIEWYVGLGESFDKAGAYGIQSAGAALVERIDGSPSNVIGLPLRETLRLVNELQISG